MCYLLHSGMAALKASLGTTEEPVGLQVMTELLEYHLLSQLSNGAGQCNWLV
ncbi:hypothetical protein BOX15_Mlig021613g1 [Macrostomum lignano]|uniref:Uncharacterized protein n=1 Tax=Macrostomum lignano TaxID=282301 RepID=A0A267DVL6_9PLAT|nr:hypothetical protein BOX15_Mlig021613g1 [Macrostomum lignano]